MMQVLPGHRTSVEKVERWTPPTTEILKLNCDAATGDLMELQLQAWLEIQRDEFVGVTLSREERGWMCRLLRQWLC